MYLTGNKINSFPDSLQSLLSLDYLFLERNNITYLPDSIGKLCKLKVLNLSNNNISLLPNSLKNLKDLQELDLKYNHLLKIPKFLGKLEKLQEVNLKGNLITKKSRLYLSDKIDLSAKDIKITKNRIELVIDAFETQINNVYPEEILTIDEAGFLRGLFDRNNQIFMKPYKKLIFLLINSKKYANYKWTLLAKCADMLYALRNYDEAIPLYKALITDGLYDINNLWKLFIIYDQRGELTEAKYYLERLERYMEYIPLNLDNFAILCKYGIIDEETYYKVRLYKLFLLRCFDIGERLQVDIFEDDFKKVVLGKEKRVSDDDLFWEAFCIWLKLPVRFSSIAKSKISEFSKNQVALKNLKSLDLYIFQNLQNIQEKKIKKAFRKAIKFYR